MGGRGEGREGGMGGRDGRTNSLFRMMSQVLLLLLGTSANCINHAHS